MTAINWDYGSHLRNSATSLLRGDSNNSYEEPTELVDELSETTEDEYEETPSLIPKRRNSRDEHYEDDQNSVLAAIVEPTFFLFAAMLIGMSALAAVARLRY
eukprot:TRINITY_DN165_c1_g1_i1.p1 TRINITY_DN165_c1_g1~~TRINITY_DN165_c1_g1_i1.p1  ORF type:complete len:102 (-),score=18.72 TRINITY_DN165_c1_g1_i1:141-446(-)